MKCDNPNCKSKARAKYMCYTPEPKETNGETLFFHKLCFIEFCRAVVRLTDKKIDAFGKDMKVRK